MIHLAQLLELDCLVKHLTEIPHLGNIDQVITSQAEHGKLFASCSTEDPCFSDVVFNLDDGSLPAHKAMLVARKRYERIAIFLDFDFE